MEQSQMNLEPGVLVLEDPDHAEGVEFPGILFGAPVSAESLRANPDRGYGEAVFNTSMTGYQEILTDPSYYGQIVCMTTPHIGNVGVNEEDPESTHPWCAGFVIHDLSDSPSNWRSNGSLDAYLKAQGIPALRDVDTRALTRHLRSRGVVRSVILPLSERSLARGLLARMPAFEGRDLISEVSTREAYRFEGKGAVQGTIEAQLPAGGPSGHSSLGGLSATPRRLDGKGFKIVALDFGVKTNLLRSLHHFGCDLEVVPAHTTAADILARKPDGVFLSNGPGDPAAAPYAAIAVRELITKKIPIFGVCMGHQILALALGAKTYKLKFGHRGGNQPVLDKRTGQVAITSQNHGYAVDADSLPSNAEVTHVHLNDQTVAGLRVKDSPAFSVQYHPEACPGPHDSVILFEQFIESIRTSRET